VSKNRLRKTMVKNLHHSSNPTCWKSNGKILLFHWSSM